MAWGGAAALVLGSLLPWASGPFGITVSGTSGDGVITLILGLILAGLIFRFPRRWALLTAAVAALAAAATAIYDTFHISGTAGLSIGFGLVLTDAGAVCVAAAIIVTLRSGGSVARSGAG